MPTWYDIHISGNTKILHINLSSFVSCKLILKNFWADPLRTPLNWRTRLQVAIDVAAALVTTTTTCRKQDRNFTTCILLVVHRITADLISF